MNAAERREAIRRLLEENEKPVSAGALAQKYGVSRQIIVGDIALLRAANAPIAATPRGYVVRRETGLLRTAACRHTRGEIAQELYAVVDNGCAVLDVIVEHSVYGQISGQLHIFSRFDADDFVERLDAGKSLPLCDLTGGVHLHTLLCPSEEAYCRVLKKLDEEKILFKKDSSED